ncbi:MAG: heme ABC exporter ATP-binding protein CcmA [Candidatus Neomarinimicrobiota bacterium]
MTTLFIAEHISKSFHLRPVLRDVSFSLHAGETVLLFGRNGAGKTTLLRILAGIMRPEAGTANLNGQPLFTPNGRWRKDMIYLGHRPILYPAFTARENLMLSVRLRKQVWDEKAFHNLMACYGLAGREDEAIRVYSEGMLQRLGLIRLELAAWQVALLDEPSAALDVEGADLLSDTIARWRSQGRTVFFTSHDLGWGATQANRALLLDLGIIRQEVAAPKADILVSHMKCGCS